MFTFEICAIITFMILGGICCVLGDQVDKQKYHGKHERKE